MIRRLLLPLALLVVLVAAASQRETLGEHAPPPSARLPWGRLTGAPTAVPHTGRPHALLYVSATCPHCEGLARYVDSLAASTGVPLVVVSADAPSAMTAWRARTGVRAPILTDASRAMQRALLLRFVPTLVAWDAAGQGRRVTGVNRRAIRRAFAGGA